MDEKTEHKIKFHYDGSFLWLIFWMIVFFPLALMLLLIKTSLLVNEASYGFKYGGSVFWLLFWTLVFFPLALVLLLLNGSFVMRTYQ